MKTAREWFKELPDDIEKMAIAEAENASYTLIDNECFDDLPDALASSFNWTVSPQGHAFWANVHEQHANK